jgi:hypothetical protein
VKAVGEERENVKTERLLASVGERESKLELPLVRGVRWQLQQAEDGGCKGAPVGVGGREKRAWVGADEGGGIEERGGICPQGLGSEGRLGGKRSSSKAHQVNKLDWRLNFIFDVSLPFFLLFLFHSQEAFKQLSQKVEELQGSVGSGVRRRSSRVGLETPGWRNWRRRRGRVRGRECPGCWGFREGEGGAGAKPCLGLLMGRCRGRESGRKWLGGSECNCGRRKRWGGMREATTCRGSGERERQIGAEIERGWDGGRRTPEAGLERLKEELAREVARLASSLEVREQEVAQFLSVSTEWEAKVERLQEQTS